MSEGISNNTEETCMSMALDLARLATGRTSPNPLVGCVVVKHKKILAVGFHRQAGCDHAERDALKKLSPAQARGATLYVTLEPCCHQGRTPPCTEIILSYGIKKVVIGMPDPDKKVSGKGIRFLRQKGLEVKVGVLREACEDLNKSYVMHRKKDRPYVILKAACSLDGRVGVPGKRTPLSGKKSQVFLHHLRDEMDAILVGIETVLVDDPLLTTRLQDRKGKDPLRVILDSRLRIPEKARVLVGSGTTHTLVVTTANASVRKKKKLEKNKHVEVWVCREDVRGRIDLPFLLQELAQRSVLSLLVEGGPTVHASFLNTHCVDELLLFYCPVFLGEKAVPLLRSHLENFYLKPVSARRLGNDVLVRCQ